MPRERKQVVTFRADAAQWARFKSLCAQRGVSPGERLRRLMDVAIMEANNEWHEDIRGGRSPADATAASERWISTVLRKRLPE